MDALKSRNTNRMVIIIQGQRLNNNKDFNISPPPPPKKNPPKPAAMTSRTWEHGRKLLIYSIQMYTTMFFFLLIEM